jgi:hypothetical protein
MGNEEAFSICDFQFAIGETKAFAISNFQFAI